MPERLNQCVVCDARRSIRILGSATRSPFVAGLSKCYEATGVVSRRCVERRDFSLAPQVGLEPTTLRLTAECSTIELLRSNSGGLFHYTKHVPPCQTGLARLPAQRVRKTS